MYIGATHIRSQIRYPPPSLFTRNWCFSISFRFRVTKSTWRRV